MKKLDAGTILKLDNKTLAVVTRNTLSDDNYLRYYFISTSMIGNVPSDKDSYQIVGHIGGIKK